MSSSSAHRNPAAPCSAGPDSAAQSYRQCGIPSWRSCPRAPSSGSGPASPAPAPECDRCPPLDYRFNGAELVDAPLDDLNRLFDGLPYPFSDRGLRNGDPDQPAAGVTDLNAALAAGAEQASERLRQLAQLCQRIRRIGVPADAHFHGVIAHGKPGIADLGIPQGAADVVAYLVELLLLDVVRVDLKQQIGAALQIEAKH